MQGSPGMFQTIRALGTATGRTAGAERLARDIQAQLDAVRTRVQGRRRPRTLLVFERDPMTLRGLYVSGGRGFLHEMLEIAGGDNVFADVQREAVQPSQETLLTRAPDVIIEVRATGLLPAAAAVSDERKAWAAARIDSRRPHRAHPCPERRPPGGPRTPRGAGHRRVRARASPGGVSMKILLSWSSGRTARGPCTC